MDALIVGAGPTGLAAALFLADQGVRCRVIDKALAPSATSRAQVVNPRTLDLLEPSRVTAAILAEARPIHRVVFYEGWERSAEINFKAAHPPYPMSVLPQARSEALLTEALCTRDLRPERGVELLSFFQDDDGVEAVLGHSDGKRETVRASLMYAADGAHSIVRQTLGIAFEGSGFPEPWPLYDLELDNPLDLDSAHVSFVKHGLVFLIGIRPGLWRVFGNVPAILDHLPPGVHPGTVDWESSFHIADRVAEKAAVGRVALGGDAAHIHAPVGARGMNLGIEDAFAFADCAIGALDDDLGRIEDYGKARHGVHQQVVSRLDKLTRLARGQPDFVGTLRRYLIPAMAKFPPTAHVMAELITGLDHDVE